MISLRMSCMLWTRERAIERERERAAAVKMVVMTEARGTPSYVSPAMQSPRYRGCVCTFFSLIGWTSEKRFSSTKRLPASKLGKGSFRRSRSFRTDRGKSRTRHEDTAVVATTRPPGVVARLMGLDSLPEAPYPPLGHCRSLPDHSRSTPVLLQDLLKQDVKPSKTTKSLRERLFSKRASYGRKGTFAAFRCRSEEWCISPTLVDIPQAQSRLMYAVTQKQNPFLSRRSANVHGEAIPELSLLQASSTGRDIVLQGWPLAGQHNVPRDLYDSDLQQESSESVGSRPTDSASSKPLLPHSKVVQGRRRGSSWHGSDDSESTIDGPAGPRRLLAPPSERHHHRLLHSRSPAAPRHPIRRSKPVTSPGPEFTATSRRRGSKSPTFKAPSTDWQPLIIPLENATTSVSHASPCTSQSSVTGELRPLSSQSPSTCQSRGSRAGRQSAKSVSSPMKNVSLAEVGKTTTTTMTKSKNSIRLPDLAPGKPPPDRAVKTRQPKGKGSPSPESQSDVSRHRSSLLSHGELWNGRKKADSKRTSPKLQRLTETVVSKHKGIQKLRQIHTPCQIEVQDVGDRLKTGNPNTEDMASQHSSNKSDELVLRKQSQAEDVASYALDCKSSEADARLLHRPVERALFSPEFDFSECTNRGAPMEISMSPLIDYDELCDSGEYDKEGDEGISSSPLIDCDGASMHVGAVTTAENESISVESYPMGEIRWEDEIVETILSGRCCERSCSGPSVSSRSATLSDEERNGDSWSSCASFNSGDCDSPSDALSESPRTKFQVKDLEVEVEVLHQEPKSPPPQLLQKTLDDESFVDETAGHPSPVSVLQSPFHDETCTTSESSPESKPQLSDNEEIMNEERNHEPPKSNNIDRIKQALLDISMFRIHDDDCSTAEHAPVPREQPKDEQRFIREVLAAAKFLSTTPPNWYSPECPMDPSLFDRLESEGVVLACGGLWRCDRKLLFDCVNEAFGLSSSRRWHLQWSPPEPVWQCPELVVAVVKNIHEWRALASYAIDSLIERDMSVAPGNWICVAPDVAAIGVEIESMVWTGILDEVAVDIVECVTRKHSSAHDRCLQSCVTPIECPEPVDPPGNQPPNPANPANPANPVNPPIPVNAVNPVKTLAL